MKTITLDDKLLEAMASITKEDMKPLISNIEINLTEKFNRTAASFEASDLAKKTISVYGGIYNSLRTVLSNKKLNPAIEANDFSRLYMNYIASEGTIQLLKNGSETTLTRTNNQRRPVNFNIQTNKTDQAALNDVMKHFYSTVLAVNSPENLKNNMTSYFELLKSYIVEKMKLESYKNCFDSFKDTIVIGKNFKVEGIKNPIIKQKEQTLLNEANQYSKGLEEFIVKPVSREEIIGNQSGIDIIETEIPCLLHYDSIEKKNLFEFQQYILFAGNKGTGKTMMARYGITLAKDMAEKVDISLAVVKLDFEDRWQYGPLENLRKQLKEISQGNRPYLVFIDEMDTKIPTRSNGENGYRKDIIGEFLRFRGGDYINNGNYLIIGTTNEPNKIDQAITSVFQIEELQGPKTKEEKTKVLYNNLKEGINQGYVQISDWKNIGEALEEYNLTGVNIVNIARNSKQKFRAIASKISFS
ncbi:MAG: ATP-binding protein [Nanoarchaeota archaeon]|nr:ATP-binding protein [Nanoarchaeota archaeon]